MCSFFQELLSPKCKCADVKIRIVRGASSFNVSAQSRWLVRFCWWATVDCLLYLGSWSLNLARFGLATVEYPRTTTPCLKVDSSRLERSLMLAPPWDHVSGYARWWGRSNPNGWRSLLNVIKYLQRTVCIRERVRGKLQLRTYVRKKKEESTKYGRRPALSVLLDLFTSCMHDAYEWAFYKYVYLLHVQYHQPMPADIACISRSNLASILTVSLIRDSLNAYNPPLFYGLLSTPPYELLTRLRTVALQSNRSAVRTYCFVSHTKMIYLYTVTSSG